jgi:hypothetical protein
MRKLALGPRATKQTWGPIQPCARLKVSRTPLRQEPASRFSSLGSREYESNWAARPYPRSPAMQISPIGGI